MTTIEKPIETNFPGRGNEEVRKLIHEAVESGRVIGVARRIGLTAGEKARLRAVQKVIDQSTKKVRGVVGHGG